MCTSLNDLDENDLLYLRGALEAIRKGAGLGWISVSVAYISFTIDESFVICSFRAGQVLQIIVHFLQFDT